MGQVTLGSSDLGSSEALPSWASFSALSLSSNTILGQSRTHPRVETRLANLSLSLRSRPPRIHCFVASLASLTRVCDRRAHPGLSTSPWRAWMSLTIPSRSSDPSARGGLSPTRPRHLRQSTSPSHRSQGFLHRLGHHCIGPHQLIHIGNAREGHGLAPEGEPVC